MTIKEQLIRDEGMRKFPYVDTVGKISIGTGRNLTDVGLSEDEVDFLLQNDIQYVLTTLNRRLPYFQSLDPVRQGVLTNMCFNMGFRGLEAFQNMLTAFAKGDWETAAAEMMASRWASEVKDRATRLAQQTRTGIWT